MAIRHGWTAQTANNAAVGPGLLLANVTESLLTPTTAWNKTAQDAFINSGVKLGATSGGLEFAYSPDYQEWEFDGVPGNIKGGRRITSAEIRISGSITEITEANILKGMPGATSVNWSTTETTPTVIGKKITNDGIMLDSNYLSNLCLVGERQGQATGIVILVYNAINTNDFTLGLNADEDRSEVDVDFLGTYGTNAQNTTTGGWNMPFSMYVQTPATAV